MAPLVEPHAELQDRSDLGGDVEPSGSELHILQNILLPPSTENAALYLKEKKARALFDNELISHGSGLISFNTYFNSFYEEYWVHYTSIEELILRISGRGTFWCNIYRNSHSAGVELIVRRLVDLDESIPGISIPVPLAEQHRGRAGRLFVELEVKDGTRLTGMCWATRRPPLREVSLGVGVCTFNREPFLLRTVQSLVEAGPDAAIAQVVVVNQGEPLQSPEFHALSKRAGGRLEIIEQANFGGAGGFTRSAMELLKRQSLTHIVFMDDDIELDPRHLVTAAAFLRYAASPVIVGGHMLDLFRPHILYEAGSAITPDNFLKPNHHNLDLRKRSSLAALSRAGPVQYNGWWFSVIPVSCFRNSGLPLPVFIRGDDMEFGVRMERAGVETVTLPPVSVWHEPFYAKPPGWQLYYDLRNRLIFASIYNDQFTLDRPLQLLKLLRSQLVRYDYQHAWFMAQALLDFLKGPALVEEGLPAIHRRITRESAFLAPVKMKTVLGIPVNAARAPPSNAAIRLRLLVSSLRVLAGRPRGFTGLFYLDMPVQQMRLGPSYFLSDREGHFFQRYVYSRRRTWAQLGRTLGAILRYARERSAASAAWKTAHPVLSSPAHWRSLLGLPYAEDQSDGGEQRRPEAA